MGALTDLSFETLQQIRSLITEEHRGGGEVRRDVTTSLGLTNYDLQRPAKMIVPVITPLLRMTARVPGNGDTMTHWKQVSALNTANLEGGVPEGQRSARVTTSATPKSATYVTIGQEDRITFESDTAAQGFEDLRANTVMRLLLAEKIAEERMLLGGNGTAVALGTPTAPTVTSAHDTTTPGTFLHSTAYSVYVVALTPAGLRNASLSGGVPSHISLTGADGESYAYGGGSSIPSSAGTLTTSTGSDDYAITASCPAVPGAVGYAWYAGTNSGTARLAKITTINSAVLPTLPLTPRQLLSALSGSDESKNAYAFDGLLPQAFASGLVTTLATGTAGSGTTLTPDGAGSIEEINQLMRDQWDNNRVSPTHLLLNSQELDNIYKGVIGAGGAPLFRFNMDANASGGEVVAGRVIGSFLNKFTPDGGQLVKIVLHPDMPAGTILGLAESIPGMIFPNSNLGTLWEMHMRRDYYQIEWPIKSRQYETGVYAEGVLAHYFPATMSVITNIANG